MTFIHENPSPSFPMASLDTIEAVAKGRLKTLLGERLYSAFYARMRLETISDNGCAVWSLPTPRVIEVHDQHMPMLVDCLADYGATHSAITCRGVARTRRPTAPPPSVMLRQEALDELTDDAVTPTPSKDIQCSRITTLHIQNAVAEHYKVTRKDLVSAKRGRQLTWFRHIAMYLCYTMIGRSYLDIGNRFGRRDHTTVIYAVRRVNDAINDNPFVRDEITSLTKKIQRI